MCDAAHALGAYEIIDGEKKIEEKALRICAEQSDADEQFLLMMKNKAENLYIDLLKPYLKQVILEINSEKE